MPHSPFLLQLLVILAVSRLCGLLLGMLKQPTVIGEMAAGIVLGPIVFGALFPAQHAELFEPHSLSALSSLSQLGLVLFMFVVGAELRAPDGARAQLKSASLVGILSVLVPMVLGFFASALLHSSLAPAGVGFWPFALFMAAAMSITAFPVMARILKERGMTQTPMGRLSMASAAIADVLAWIMLAVVVALTGIDGSTAIVKTTLGLVVLVAVIFILFKPLCAWLLRTYVKDGCPGLMMLSVLAGGAMGCAALTQWLGVHAVFGAFLFGACLPRDDRLLKTLVERLEFPALVLLMPVFFAIAGLSTTTDAFTPTHIGALILVILVAVAGKVLGGAAGARVGGLAWRDSFAVGSLMNARGLMELIVMKVGLDAGLIGPEMFTMLLVMAILTTAMTAPLLSLFSAPSRLP
ncbi:cation:proton antiporter [Pseudomonas nitroreducens]|uniref:cation:proton antiporter domain-containing protein n=1 Tax=Pseudomonas nitroreducens TaxID=46680 RepID=UPI003CC8286E